MVYKNLYNRLFFALFFFVLYFISLNNKYLLFVFGTLIYLFVLYEVIKFFKKFFNLILFYLMISYFCFVLYFYASYNFIIFNIFVFTIIFFDSFSYFSGTIFGKKFIFKSISPKKTLEGYLGGLIFTNITLLVFFYIINIEIMNIRLIILINLIIFISIIGDLIESFFKRKNYIKDSSNFLSGHGGFFDRFDSFISSIMMLALFSLF